jgi:hypothetical protein
VDELRFDAVHGTRPIDPREDRRIKRAAGPKGTRRKPVSHQRRTEFIPFLCARGSSLRGTE